MRVRSVDLDENGNPSAATVTLTRKELQLIAKMLGDQSHEDVDRLLPGHAQASSDIYRGLTGLVFNPYWDDGLSDAIQGFDG